MEGLGSRFPISAGVCGIVLAVLLTTSAVANGACPSDECAFYCSKPAGKEIPFVTLFKDGDHKYPCDLMHKVGGAVAKPVRVANSFKCEMRDPKKPSPYSDKPCDNNLYVSDRHVASRTFNQGHPIIDMFLGNCIKIYIGSAQYSDSSNYNSGKADTKSCVMVQTDNYFI